MLSIRINTFDELCCSIVAFRAQYIRACEQNGSAGTETFSRIKATKSFGFLVSFIIARQN